MSETEIKITKMGEKIEIVFLIISLVAIITGLYIGNSAVVVAGLLLLAFLLAILLNKKGEIRWMK